MNIEEYLGLVGSIVSKYKSGCIARNYDFDDLFQEGCIGLIKANDTYNPNLGIQFTTYAYPHVWGYINKYFRNDKSFFGKNEDRIKGLARPAISLDAQYTSGEEDGNLMATLGENDFEEDLVTKIYVKDLLSKLNTKEQFVVEKIYLENYTQTEVAKALDTSQTTVCRIRDKALKKMRGDN